MKFDNPGWDDVGIFYFKHFLIHPDAVRACVGDNPAFLAIFLRTGTEQGYNAYQEGYSFIITGAQEIMQFVIGNFPFNFYLFDGFKLLANTGGKKEVRDICFTVFKLDTVDKRGATWLPRHDIDYFTPGRKICAVTGVVNLLANCKISGVFELLEVFHIFFLRVL